MELKEGYKQTEFGLIPDDWSINKLGEIAKFYNGKAHEQSISEHGDYFVVNSKFISTEGSVYKTSKENICPLEKGIIVMVMSDIPNGKALAKCFMIPKSNKYTLNQRICAISSEVIDNEFLIRKLNRNDFYLSFDSGTGQTNLKREDVLNCPIAYPSSIQEQKAIAQVLNDTDSLLQTLEQKLAKKRAIKQGAMQLLLTPKQDWEVMKLGEIANIKTGSKNNQDKIGDGLYPFFVRSQTVERINSYSYDCEAILIPGEGGIGSIYHYVNGKFDVHQRVYKISDFEKDVLGKFIYLYMMKNFNVHAMKNSVKATVDSLRLPTFLEFEVFVPSFEEQTLIANILSDMDAEIGQLEQKLEKYKLLKQGLMQELLTGRIRLI